MNKIPIFLHIPKNSGTYVLSWTMCIFRYWGNQRGLYGGDLRRISITQDNKTVMTIFAHVPNCVNNTKFLTNALDKSNSFIDMYTFLSELLKKQIEVFSMCIEAAGFCFLRQKLMGLVLEMIKKEPLYYTCIRDAFSRNQSLYNYINSQNSVHELTHGCIKSKTFLDYIKSPEMEDSWLIRNLTGISNNISITEKDFENSCDILNIFKITNIKNVDQIMDDVFYECYMLKRDDVPKERRYIFKNETPIPKINFLDLDRETQDIFLKKTEFDQKIYKRYCEK